MERPGTHQRKWCNRGTEIFWNTSKDYIYIHINAYTYICINIYIYTYIKIYYTILYVVVLYYIIIWDILYIYISRSTKLVPSLWPSFTSHSSHGISLGQVAGEKLAEVMWCFPPRHPWTGGSWPTKISWYNGNTMGEYHGNIMGKSCVHKWECDGKFHMYLYMEIIWEIIYQSTGSSSFGSFLSDGGTPKIKRDDMDGEKNTKVDDLGLSLF